MTEAYDIAVIGAGPAGANFARLVRSDHQKILVIYDDTREKPCGGLLSPDAQRVLASYDAVLPGEVLTSPQIFAVKVLDLDRGLVRRYPRHYLNMNRAAFDAWLRSLMPPSVKLVRGRCVSLTDEGETFSIRTADGSVFAAKRLVGADGASSLVRRTFFRNRKIRRFTAIQQNFPAQNDEPFYSCIFDSKTSPACSWILFKDGVLTYGGAFAPHGCREQFERQKEKLIRRGILPSCVSETETEACEVLAPSFSGFCTGNDRIFLIGEAAGFISPSSFEGISFALRSGEMLADALRAKNPACVYRRKTAALRRTLRGKAVKRFFLATPFLRHLIMRSGLTAIPESRHEKVHTEPTERNPR